MITVRIVRNVFTGDYENIRLDGPMAASELRAIPEIGDAPLFRDGKALDDTDLIADGDLIIAQIVPKGATATLAVLATISIFAAIVGTAVTLSMISSIPSARKLQTNPSLRGSTNSARKNQAIPILLGQHRIYPDVAALPYTLYRDDDQYLRQLFSFGYNAVSIDRSTIKIGETLLTKYQGYTIADDFSDLYSQRCIESSIGIELTYDDEPSVIERTTASNTWKFAIGIMAPQGIGGDGEDASVGIRIEWRTSGEGSWTTAVDTAIKADTDKLRRMYEVTPPTPGTFDVRVQRTTKESDDASVIDMIYLDVLQCWTQNSSGSKAPIASPERFSLLAVELKATDQLNGIIDELNAVCTLRARVYDGTGTGPSAWHEGDAQNPSSAILYLLTDPYANPKPLSDDEIVWGDFERFYLYADEHGFECNAYISSEEYSIEDICGYIAESNLAQIRKAGNRIGIIIDEKVDHFTQLFTPRNAWNFSVQKSFSNDIRYFRIKYVDASLGYVETERTVSLDTDGNIVFDTAIPEDESGAEISLVGVTDPEHAAYVGRQRLREIARQKRTFTWTSDIEGILCVPGDVVLLEHDQFSIGLGEGRIRRIIKDDRGIVTGIELDSALPFEDTKVYSIIIRSGRSISESLTITATEDSRTLTFRATPIYELRVGDLCAVGEYSKETIQLMITSIERDQDGACSITAVDYDPAIYAEGEIPPYDPGISKYPDAGSIGTGAQIPEGFIPESRPGADGGDPRSLYQYSASPDIPPDETKSLIVWGDSVIAWGGTAFAIEMGEWSPTIPYPRPEGKPYLWEKCWSYELGKWQVFCRAQAALPDFDVSFIPTSYRLTSRGMTKGSTVIRAICQRYNTNGDIVWTVPEILSSGCYYPVQGSKATIDIPIPDGLTDLPSFTVVCHVASAGSKSYSISGTVEGKKDVIYLGVYGPSDELPEITEEGDPMIGDHLMIQNESGQRDPYYWNGTEWVLADGNMPISFGFRVLQDTLWDAVKAPTASTTLSAYNLLAANIGSNLLFSYYAKIRNLLVGDGTADTGFRFEAFDYVDGEKATPVIRAIYDGDVVFQIDPVTGNVFFGQPDDSLTAPATGFMYKASDQSIISAGERFKVSADGYMSASGASVSGTINASSGSFGGTISCRSFKVAPSTDSALQRITISTTDRSAKQIRTLISDLQETVETSTSLVNDMTISNFDNRLLRVYSSNISGLGYVLFTNPQSNNTSSVLQLFDQDMEPLWLRAKGLPVQSTDITSAQDTYSLYTLADDDGTWLNQTITMTLYVGLTDTVRAHLLINPSNAEKNSLDAGELYADANGNVKIKLGDI